MKRLLILAAMLLASCTSHGSVMPATQAQAQTRTLDAHRQTTGSIAHIVIIMMENRSFDTYFGKFPGANGIPANPNCNPDPVSGQCIYPYHDTSLTNYGGPHSTSDMIADMDGGRFDGFVISANKYRQFDPNIDEVMGYHTRAEIPYYWDLAKQNTLADNHFAADTSWSTMAHLYLVSGWSASCTIQGDPMSCTSSNDVNPNANPDYAWTDITWLLHQHGISWAYYIARNALMPPNDGGDGEAQGETPDIKGLSMWNPLPGFDDVRIDGESNNIQPVANFHTQALSGTLPAVSWLIPPYNQSDHPSVSVANGQSWVKWQIGAIESGPDAQSTIILLTWDEWGGFYDHVVPPVIDGQGYGFRTPLIIVGPMVMHGHIDHQLLSSDAYLKLIEDTFLSSERIDANDGRKDSRPDVREDAPGLGDISNDLTSPGTTR